MLANISSMAILVEYSFFDAYAGESRNGGSAARFYTGDTVSMIAAIASADDINDLSYACLALFKSRFLTMEGATAGVCLRCQSKPRVACIYVWKSLQFCYSWIINSNQRKSMLPYLDQFPLDIKYDIYRVVYVSGDVVLNFQAPSPTQMLENGESKEEGKVM
jgi:hypothetical protein